MVDPPRGYLIHTSNEFNAVKYQPIASNYGTFCSPLVLNLYSQLLIEALINTISTPSMPPSKVMTAQIRARFGSLFS